MKSHVLAFLSIFFLVSGWQKSLTAQVTTDQPYALSEELPVRPDVRRGKLANGLQYYIAYNAKPEDRAELRLAVHAGSMQEDEDQLGVAHFVEHMAFNGTKHFEKNELVDYLESTGTRFGADLNAYTSFDETVYMLQARTDSLELLEQGLLILEDWASGVTFDEEEVDKERGVVISEWRTRLSAQQRMQQQTLPVMLKGSRYAERLPIGEPEIIENVSVERIKDFYEDWYRPDLMAVVAIGDFDVDWMEQQVRERFSRVPAHPNPRERKTYSVPGHEETLYGLVTDEEAPFTNAQVMYKHPDEPVKTVADYRRSLLESFHNRMFNFRLQEISMKPDPPFTFAYAGYGSNIGDMAAFTASATTADGETIPGLEAVLVEVKRAMQHGFTEGELERQKAEFMTAAERAYRERDKQQSGRLAGAAVNYFLNDGQLLDEEQQLELYQQLLPMITVEEVNSISENWMTEENRVVIVTGPEKKDVPLPTEAELQALFERVEQTEVEPYVEQVNDAPLLEAELEETPIVAEKYYESVDVHELKLANGITVALKSTDFKNDEILMTAFSPGGHSLYKDSEYWTADMASSLIAQGGAGDFDFIDLQKKLAGKTANVGPSISELYEGVSGSSSPEDLETMLQLAYLHLTAPRKDPDALAAFKTRQINVLQNLATNPEYSYAIDTRKIRYNDHPRRQAIPTVENIEGIDLDRAYEMYRDRFADFSDFTFIFVGNFDVEEMKPLLSTYLGNLPGINREETWRDVGADIVEGVIDSTFVRGQTQKARVDITFHGDFDYYDSQSRYDFSSLIRVLNIKLRESMREEKGGVYGVNLRGFNTPEPDPRYTISLSFTCDPAEVEELVATAMREIEKVKENGAEEKDLQKVRETQRQTRIKNLKENRFWFGNLSTRYRYGLPIDGIGLESLEEKINELDGEDMKRAARKYFDMENYMKFVLLPEAEAKE